MIKPPPPPTLATDDGRIPVCLLTGFLGAGKTTVLNRLVRHSGMEGTVLLINEFGEIGIDHHLVDTVDESILLLDSGCVCCAMHGDFVATLKSLHERLSHREIPDIRRVVVETTGLADPVPIIYTLMEERYVSARYVCDSVLTAVDASLGADQLARHPEAVRQVAMADRLLITKTDIGGRAQMELLDCWLNALNPGAPRLTVTNGAVAPSDLFSGGIYSPSGRIPDVATWLGEQEYRSGHVHHHARGHGTGAIDSFFVRFEQPVSWRGLAIAMGRILKDHGNLLLRAKGVIAVAGCPSPMVVQCVQDVAYPAVRLAAWPDEGPLADRKGRIVFIGQGLKGTVEADIRSRLESLPADPVAMRALAASPLLPTRCWLNERLPWMGKGAFETEGWIVQPPIRSRGL